MARLRSIVVNIGWLGGAQLLDYVLRAAVAVAVARHLGVGYYGSFAAALSLVLMAAVFADFGLRMTVLKTGASNPAVLPGVAALATGAKAVLLAALYVLLLALAAALGMSGMEFLLVGVLGAGIFLGSFMELFTAVLQARERMALMGSVTVGFRAVLLAAVLAAILFGGDIVGIAIAYAAASLLGALIAAAVALPHLRSTPFSRPRVEPLLRQTLQFGAAGVLAALFLQADIVMLRVLHGPEQTGLYAAAFRLVAMLYAVPIVVQAAVIPRLYRYASDPERLREAYRVLVRWSLAASAALAACAVALAPTLVATLFGEGFRAAWPAFAVLALNLCLHQLNYVGGDTLYALGRQGWRAAALAAAVALNIAVNFFAIPRFGAAGAAWTTVASELFLLLLLFASLQRRFHLAVLRTLVPPLAVGALAGLLLWAVRELLPLLAQLALGAVAAAAVPLILLLTRYLRPGEALAAEVPEGGS